MRAARDHFVGVHVGLRAGAGLEHDQREFGVPLPSITSCAARTMSSGFVGGKLAQLAIRERGAFFQDAQSARITGRPQWNRAMPIGKFMPRTFGLRAPQMPGGYLHVAQRIVFDAEFVHTSLVPLKMDRWRSCGACCSSIRSIILSTIVCGSASIVAGFFDRSGRTRIRIARVWGRSLLQITGVRVEAEGLEKIDPQGAYVFVSNHLSYMDTPVVLSTIPVQFRFMAKKGLFQIPFLGTHLAQAGHIPVPREDPRAAVKSLTRAAEIIRDKDISVLLFPEGGRSMDGALQPFKEGAAYIAIKAGVPIVPVTLIGTRAILAMGSATFHRGPVTLRMGDPMPTAVRVLRDRHELTEAAREQIVAMLAK